MLCICVSHHFNYKHKSVIFLVWYIFNSDNGAALPWSIFSPRTTQRVTIDVTLSVLYNVTHSVTLIVTRRKEADMTTAEITVLEKRSAANAIEQANEYLGLTYTGIAEALGVHRQTVFRYRKLKSVPSPEVQESMAQIRELLYLLSEVFIDRDAQLEWLYGPVPLLRNRRPIDLIKKGDFDAVMSVLAGQYSGAFA